MVNNNITIQISDDFGGLEIDPDKIKTLIETICRRFTNDKVTVSLAIVDDKKIKIINKEFLDHAGATDVISFDLSQEQSDDKLFDIVINAEMAQKQAKTRGHMPQAELALYITHGLLHNFGFDDRQNDQAEKMHKLEDEILQQLGYGVIYNK